jgi:hypothetical protein
LFYSPDFEANNSANSGYQVKEGQAYLYQFDISALVDSRKLNTLQIANRGQLASQELGHELQIQLRQVNLFICILNEP